MKTVDAAQSSPLWDPNLPTPSLCAVVGSVAYGLDHAGSDVDRRGIYVAPTRELLGLDTQAATRTVESHDPSDITLYELGKFASLALKANPTVLELLFVDDYEVLDTQGKSLVEIRSVFLSRDAVRKSFGGYAASQAHRLLSRTNAGKAGFGSVPVNRIAKHGRHCARLLKQGEELLTTGRLTMHVGDDREAIFAAGQLAVESPEDFVEYFDERLARFDNLESTLPERPDYEAVNEAVVQIRLAQL